MVYLHMILMIPLVVIGIPLMLGSVVGGIYLAVMWVRFLICILGPS